MEELELLQIKYEQSTDFLESMDLLSQIEDLKVKLGLVNLTTTNNIDNSCENCSA